MTRPLVSIIAEKSNQAQSEFAFDPSPQSKWDRRPHPPRSKWDSTVDWHLHGGWLHPSPQSKWDSW